MKPKSIKHSVYLLLLVGFLLVGCRSVVRPEQLTAEDSIYLDPGHTLGQTFNANFDGMNGVELFVEPPGDLEGSITLVLTDAPDSDHVIATSTVESSSLYGPGFYRFTFPKIEHSTTKDYYFRFTSTYPVSLVVKGSAGDTYVDGAAYRDDVPLDNQLAFRLSYDLTSLGLGILVEFVKWTGYLLAAIFLFVIPGLAFLMFVLPDYARLDWFSAVALSTGISMAVLPILFLFTHIVGLQLGVLYAWLPPIFGLAYLGYRVFYKRTVFFNFDWKSIIRPDLSTIGLVIVVVAVVFSRFWVIRDLNAPLWGDSYHHAMISQLMVDHGGLFTTWEPYAELYSFTYHFGFHTAVAVFHWLTRMPVIQSTLWIGQIINIFAVVALYPLAVRFTGQRWAGVAAVLFAGLLSTHPQYYVNWGRYTQLAGQVILPAMVILIFELFDRKNFSWKLSIFAGAILAGLGLTHYRIIIIFALFVVARMFFVFASNKNLANIVKGFIVLGVSAILLFMPWLINIFDGVLSVRLIEGLKNLFVSGFSSGGQPTSTQSIYFLSYYPSYIWLGFVIVTLGIFWRRNIELCSFITWYLLCLLFVNPQWIGIPRFINVDSFTLLIMTYLWVGSLLGISFGWLTRKFTSRRLFNVAILVVTVSITVFGLQRPIKVMDQLKYQLITRPDERAMSWIDKNLPKNATFLVNSFPAFNDVVVVGSDGGWWLPLAAKRMNTVPPILYDIEKGKLLNQSLFVNVLTFMIRDQGMDSPAVLQELINRKVNYVYIGQQNGLVNNSGYRILPENLVGNPNFEIVYHQDRVWIFKVQP